MFSLGLPGLYPFLPFPFPFPFHSFVTCKVAEDRFSQGMLYKIQIAYDHDSYEKCRNPTAPENHNSPTSSKPAQYDMT